MKNSKIPPSVFVSFWLISLALCPIFAQKAMTIKESCNFAAADSSHEFYTYAASKEALEMVGKIVKAIGLPQNFVLKSADCKNALATSEGKQRYILYSTSFLENFKKAANTEWAAQCVMAHEIGHHLSNHDLEATDPSVRKQFELEADKFAGDVLFKLGATLEQAQAGINTFSLEGASKTHPAKRARLEAISVGWKQAQETAEKGADTEGVVEAATDENQLFKRAVAEKNAELAIQMLDSLIELNGNFTDAYFERGKREKDKEDFRRNFEYALEDFNVYLKTRTKNPMAYYERGFAFILLNKNKEAILDFDRAVKMKPDYAEAYNLRAVAKRKLEQYDGAIRDFNLAVKYKPDFADAYYEHGNMLYGEAKYDEAIVQFDKALRADANHFESLSLRAAAKQFSSKYLEAIADYNLLEKKQGKDFKDFYSRASCFQALKKHQEAILDWDKAIEQQTIGIYEPFCFRGASKYALGRVSEAILDFNKALEMTVLKMNCNIKIGCALVEFGLNKEAMPYFDKVSEGSFDEKLKECKEEALRKMKK